MARTALFDRKNDHWTDHVNHRKSGPIGVLKKEIRYQNMPTKPSQLRQSKSGTATRPPSQIARPRVRISTSGFSLKKSNNSEHKPLKNIQLRPEGEKPAAKAKGFEGNTGELFEGGVATFLELYTHFLSPQRLFESRTSGALLKKSGC